MPEKLSMKNLPQSDNILVTPKDTTIIASTKIDIYLFTKNIKCNRQRTKFPIYFA